MIFRKIIIYNSQPDYDENLKLLSISPVIKNVTLVVVVEDKKKFHPSWVKSKKNIILINKNSLSSIFFYCISNIVISTHGFYNNIPKINKKVIINLWHGMPLKKIGLLDKQNNYSLPKFDYILVSNNYYKKLFLRAFGVQSKNVLIMNNPRLDLLNYKDTHEDFNVIWTPTFRDKGLKKFYLDQNFLNNLDIVLHNNDINLTLKVHPIEEPIIDELSFKNYTNITFITNCELRKSKLTFYEFISENFSVIITDVSSIFLDAIEKNFPFINFMPDFYEYVEESRDLLQKYKRNFHNKVIFDVEALVKTLTQYKKNKIKQINKRSSYMKNFEIFLNELL